MNNEKASPSVESGDAKKHGNLPFLDRIMEDLDRPGHAIAFDSQAKAGERFR